MILSGSKGNLKMGSTLDVIVGKGAIEKAVADGIDKFIRETKGGSQVLTQISGSTQRAYLFAGVAAGIAVALLINKLISKQVV